MASFAGHAVFGAGVMSSLIKLYLGVKSAKWVLILAYIYGLILGAWPDVADWFAALVGWYPRWFLYGVYHHSVTVWLLNPPFTLHVVSDLAFHDPFRPGWDWWAEKGWLEILMWSAAALLFWYSFW